MSLPGYDAWKTASPPEAFEPGDGMVVCPECEGRGFVLDEHSDREDCAHCGGTGEVPDDE